MKENASVTSGKSASKGGRSHVRWLVPSSAMLVWATSVALVVAVAAFVIAEILRTIGLWIPSVAAILTSAWMAIPLSAAVGATRTTSDTIAQRLTATHREMPAARSPVAWAWAIALASAAGMAASAAVLGPPELTAPGALTAGLVALASVVAAGLASIARTQLDGLGQQRAAGRRPTNSRPYFTDEPIQQKSEDALGRQPVVDALLEAIDRSWGERATFISLEGIWGSGKSSLVALARTELRAAGVIEGVFTGFHFATRDRLAEALLESIAATISRRYATTDVKSVLLSIWESSRSIADRLSPVGAPGSLRSATDATRHFKALIKSVPRPVVIFVEDVDRLTGHDVLTLISAVMSVDDLPGFVFVMVMDRDQVATELASEVANGGEYLRKLTTAAIRVPPPATETLFTVLNRHLDEVMSARGRVIEDGALGSIPRSVWTTFLPTVRHVKHLTNAFSATLAQVGGEINTGDVLLLTLLEEFAPETLRSVRREPSLWMEDTEDVIGALLAGRATPEDRRTKRREALEQAEPSEPPRRAAKEILDFLFPEGGDVLAQLRGQRVSQPEYFRRFVERRVAPGKVSDDAVKELIRAINAAPPEKATQAIGEALSGGGHYALLDKLTVFADLVEETHRAAVVTAVARSSIELVPSDSVFLQGERERARALTFRLLELGRGDPEWQRATIEAAIKVSSSLEFARELVGLAEAGRNAILTEFAAFDSVALRAVLASEVQRRLEDGLDPFSSEGRYAPYILASIENPKLAADYAVRLGQVGAVLDGYAVRSGLPGSKPGIQWDKLCPDFDVATLRTGASSDHPLTGVLLSTEAPCGTPVSAVPEVEG